MVVVLCLPLPTPFYVLYSKMMQRGSSSTMARNILIGSISVIMLLVVLYYLKRVEVGRLKHDMDDMLVSVCV